METVFPVSRQNQIRSGGSLSLESSHYSSFVTGPEKFEGSITVPTVFTYNNGTCEKFFLIIYQTLKATICLFIDGNEFFCF